ncbi:hypothetical protein WBG83_00010 [Paenibacillus sp. y28]
MAEAQIWQGQDKACSTPHVAKLAEASCFSPFKFRIACSFVPSVHSMAMSPGSNTPLPSLISANAAFKACSLAGGL